MVGWRTCEKILNCFRCTNMREKEYLKSMERGAEERHRQVEQGAQRARCRCAVTVRRLLC